MNTSTNSSQPGGASAPSAPSTPASSPSPSSTPAAAPSSAPGGSQSSPPGAASSNPSGADTTFDFMDGIFDTPPNPTPAPGAAQAAPAEGTPTQTPPEPIVPPQAPAQATPQPAPPATSASGTPGEQPAAPAATTAAAPSPQFDPGDPIGLARGLAEHEAEAIEHMAKTTMALSPQELEALEANPGEMIPKLLSKAIVKTQQMMLQILGQAVPKMLETRTNAVSKNEEAMGNFFKAWPALDPKVHKPLVHEMGMRFRKMFPKSTTEQMIEQLGPMVLSAAKLPITAMNQAPAPIPAPAAAPKASGFVPAAPGAVVQTTPVPDDTFGYLGQ